MRTHTYIIGFFCFLSVVACGSNQFNTPQELQEYLADPKAGYVVEQSSGGINFQLTYRPTDLLVAQHLGDPPYKKEDIDQWRAHYGKQLYWVLSMEHKQQELLSSVPQNREQFGALSHLLSFEMGNWVRLVSSQQDTLALITYDYPRMYGMHGTTSLLFVFDKSVALEKNKSLSFELDDFLGWDQNLSFSFPTALITAQPQINFTP